MYEVTEQAGALHICSRSEVALDVCEKSRGNEQEKDEAALNPQKSHSSFALSIQNSLFPLRPLLALNHEHDISDITNFSLGSKGFLQ